MRGRALPAVNEHFKSKCPSSEVGGVPAWRRMRSGGENRQSHKKKTKHGAVLMSMRLRRTRRASASNSRRYRPFICRDGPSKPAFCVPAASSGSFCRSCTFEYSPALDARKARTARQRARPFGPPFGRFPRQKFHFPCRHAKILLQPLRRRSFSRRWLRLFFACSPIYREIKTFWMRLP